MQILSFIKNLFVSSYYSQESIDILKKYFGNKAFNKNKTMAELKEKLELKDSIISKYSKYISTIIDSTKHKSEIHYNYNMKNNKPFSSTTILKICSNEVIDLSLLKNIEIKDSIALLFLSFEDPYVQEMIEEAEDEEFFIEYFYEILPDFLENYNKKLNI